MEFRLARLEDLKQLKIIYKEIIKNMNKNNIQIWDDIYPCEIFEDDINNKRLYVIANDEEIISAFALCDNNAGEAYVEWSEKSAKAMYIDRLGVNVEYSDFLISECKMSYSTTRLMFCNRNKKGAKNNWSLKRQLDTYELSDR